MSLEGQSESLKESDRVQSTVCSFEIATDKEKLGKQQLQEYEARNALDSDKTLPNIELDSVIDNNVLNGASQKLSDDTHINEEDINESQKFDEEEDDFGSFNEDLENFDRASPANQQIPVFDTLSEALDIWQKLLNQIYDQRKPLDNFTNDAPKSIRVYVLEEASESLHSRLTWDSVTRYMDNDTGIPKVRWYQSEIEKFHLKALACKRSAESILHTGPTMLDTTDLSNYSYQSSNPEPVNNIPVVRPSDAQTFEDITISTATAESNNTTPTSDKRSSVFGLSSFSRYLPHLTKTNLPRSPTSPIPPAPSQSLSRHQDASIPSTMALNHMNIRSDNVHQQQHVSNDINMGKLKRSNTVAFSSIRAKASNNSILNILDDDDDQDPKPRPTSFHGTSSQTKPPTVSMDLFDLTDDDQVLKSPTSLEFNTSSFKPLVPVVSPVSPSTCITATNTTVNRRNTLPASTRSDAILEPITTDAHINMADDDEFGDFTGEQDNAFDDFTNPPSNDIDDPFGILNYTQPKPQQQHHMRSMSTPHARSNAILTPTQVMPLTTGDMVSSSEKKGDSHIEKRSTIQRTVDLFDFNVDMSSNAVTDQSNTSENKLDNDDDDWGDWAF